MKIRSDFVTNSSSTCYIVISSEKLDKEKFADFLGFKKDSVFWPKVEEALCYMFEHNMRNSKSFGRDGYYGHTNFEEFVKDRFSEETYKKVLEALDKNRNVYYGTFSSDDPDFLSFFCCDSILVEDKGIYWDATECSW